MLGGTAPSKNAMTFWAARRAKALRLARTLAAAAPGLTAGEVAAAVASPRVRRDAEAAAGTRPGSDTTWQAVADLLAFKPWNKA